MRYQPLRVYHIRFPLCACTTIAPRRARCIPNAVGCRWSRRGRLHGRGFIPRQVIIKLGTSGATVGDINATYGSTTLEGFPGSSDVYLLQLRAGSGVIETVEKMTPDGRLLYAEPNFVAQTPEGDARHKAYGVSDVAPTSQDYAALALNLSVAQNISRGEGVTVAVLDTGAQLDHLAYEELLRLHLAGVPKKIRGAPSPSPKEPSLAPWRTYSPVS
jgi:hypothetical protein